MKDYDSELKKTVDINIISLNNKIKDCENEKRKYMVNYNEISVKIKSLPKELQKKIFILAMKFFWRNDTLYNSKVPLYSKYNEYLITQKKRMSIDNVHFLHLDFNTLPENKTYILGCQCKYCIDFSREKKDELFNYVCNSRTRFLKTITCDEITFGNGVSLPNDYYIYEYISYVNGFNFTKGRFYNALDDDPKESPIYFSSEIVDRF